MPYPEGVPTAAQEALYEQREWELMPDILKHLPMQNNLYRRRNAWYPDDRGLCEAALEVAELAEALCPLPTATGKRPPHFLSS